MSFLLHSTGLFVVSKLQVWCSNTTLELELDCNVFIRSRVPNHI